LVCSGLVAGGACDTADAAQHHAATAASHHLAMSYAEAGFSLAPFCSGGLDLLMATQEERKTKLGLENGGPGLCHCTREEVKVEWAGGVYRQALKRGR
jgi:hypothetical protein